MPLKIENWNHYECHKIERDWSTTHKFAINETMKKLNLGPPNTNPSSLIVGEGISTLDSGLKI